MSQVTWQSPQLAPAAVGIAAVVAAAVLWLYPPQTLGVPRVWRWAMPGLRALAVAALTLSIVQPIVLRPRTAARQGAIVLMVDRSRSMSVVDRDRSPAELVALAGGLGALPAGSRQEAAPGLRAQLDSLRALLDQTARARSEAEYAMLSGRGAAPAAARLREVTERLRGAIAALPVPPSLGPQDLGQRVAALRQLPPLLDDAALAATRKNVDATARALAEAQARLDEALFKDSAEVRSVGTRLSMLSRAELVEVGLVGQAAAGDETRRLLAAMSAAAPVFGFAFDQDIAPLEWSARERAGNQLGLTATGSRTDVAEALRAAMQHIGSRAVQAIVLISDGRQVGADADGLNADLAASGVPVLAVSAAAPAGKTSPRDLAVVAVDAPDSARVGQTIPVRAQIRATGLDSGGGDTRVVVSLDGGGDQRHVREVALGEEGDGVVDFELTLADPGRRSLAISAALASGDVVDSREATRENNRFVHWLRVGAEPVRVMVVSGDASSAKQHATLRDALSRAAWVALREVDQDEIAGVTPRSILAQDVVVLVDVPVEALSRAQWQAIEQLVRQRGGSVILCAGLYVPHEYVEDPLTAPLLPFDAAQLPSWRTWPGGEPHFRVAPPATSSDRDGLASDEPVPDAWRQLPPLSQYLPLPPPGASARALLVERDTGAAVVTETRRGLGRLYFIGTDQTWRWRGPGRGEQQRDQFWPRLMRLASGEPFTAVQENVHLDVDDIAPEPQQPLAVRARVMDAYGDPLDEPTQTLEILKNGATLRREAPQSLGARSGQYQAVIEGLDAGDYVLRVQAPEDPSAEIPPDPTELPLRVAPRYEAELADVSGDEQLLRRIAAASGGQFLSLEQLGTLPARLETIRQRQSRLVEYPLWDSPYLFVFVLACLSAEWALRKRFGLA